MQGVSRKARRPGDCLAASIAAAAAPDFTL